MAAVTNWVKLKFAAMNLKTLAIHKDIERKFRKGHPYAFSIIVILFGFFRKYQKLGQLKSSYFDDIMLKNKSEFGGQMKEIFYLNKETLPTIPVPHDCVVEKFQIDGQYLTFTFESDISYHDSIKEIAPKAKSLIIRYHLTDKDSFSVYKWKKPNKFSRGKGCYVCLDNLQLTKPSKNKIEYLYHNIGYSSIIIKLFSEEIIIIDADVDYLEYEWIENV